MSSVLIYILSTDKNFTSDPCIIAALKVHATHSEINMVAEVTLNNNSSTLEIINCACPALRMCLERGTYNHSALGEDSTSTFWRLHIEWLF